MKRSDKIIYQYGNLAGWPYFYAKGLSDLGEKSISVKPVENDFVKDDGTMARRNLPTHKSVCRASDNRLKRLIKKLIFFLRNRNRIRLIHYHSTTMLPGFFDIIYFKLMKIPMIITWGGGDARIIGIAREKNPYFYLEPDEKRDKETINKLRFISKYVKNVAADPELSEYSRLFFDKIYILRQPIDLKKILLNIPQRNLDCPRLLHIPTYQNCKGTKYILEAVERLKKEGYNFDFRLMEADLTQKQTRKRISECDIYVDELRVGSYGMTAVEAMASGKVVITYIRDDLVNEYPEGLPVVNSNPDTVYNNLKNLLEKPELISEIGKKSREYAERYHDTKVVCSQLIDIYKEIGMK